MGAVGETAVLACMIALKDVFNKHVKHSFKDSSR